MVKLFLVEDEIIIRDGIKKNIDWEKEGIDFVGEASDGELAYPMIQKTQPDILITDIKMPFMDGLELCRLVRKDFPKMKIIILSGYDDFSYAQKAVSLKVTEYLLKPITPVKLLESIHVLKEDIEREQEINQAESDIGIGQDELIKIEKQNFFRKLVKGEMSLSDILDTGESLGMNLSASWYQVVLCYIDVTGNKMKETAEPQNYINDERPENLFLVNGFYEFDRGTEGIALVILGDSEDDLRERLKLCMDSIEELKGKYEQLYYFVGIGSMVNRLREIKQSYRDANRAYSRRYLTHESQVVIFDQMERESQSRKMDLGEIDMQRLNHHVVRDFLRMGSEDEVAPFIKEYMESMGSENIQSLIFMQYITMDIYLKIASYLEELGYKIEEVSKDCGDINEVIRKYTYIDKIEDYFISVIKIALGLRDNLSRKKNLQTIEQAKQYIQKNYAMEDISLNSVASYVGISPNYLSSMFSQETGQTFIEYLTQIRMEQAKKLMQTTNMKSADISYEVGYNDPHYFSAMFKKTMGCTVREFRNNIRPS